MFRDSVSMDFHKVGTLFKNRDIRRGERRKTLRGNIEQPSPISGTTRPLSYFSHSLSM
uniref:Uncharacterized protein n=1 Tax=Picea glauca TaxID=3330 RepID=A0A117NIU5_PICGL|nr:hypothetical protein ABT39_MTgene263 [Picea glauca]